MVEGMQPDLVAGLRDAADQRAVGPDQVADDEACGPHVPRGECVQEPLGVRAVPPRTRGVAQMILDVERDGDHDSRRSYTVRYFAWK